MLDETVQEILSPIYGAFRALKLLDSIRQSVADGQAGTAIAQLLIENALTTGTTGDVEPPNQAELAKLTDSIAACVASALPPEFQDHIHTCAKRVQAMLRTAEKKIDALREADYRLFRKGLIERPVTDQALGEMVTIRCESCGKRVGRANTRELRVHGLVASAFQAVDGRRSPSVSEPLRDWYCKNCGDLPVKDARWVLLDSYQFLPVPNTATAAL